MPPWTPSANTCCVTHPNVDPALLAERKAELYRAAPLHPRGDLLTWSRTVIFSPHPDDESLGCGGLIRLLRGLDRTVYVVFVTDGGMSHPASVKFDRPARVRLRQQEAIAACEWLGIAAEHVKFLGLPDGQAPFAFSTDFPAAVRSLSELLAPWGPDTFVVPWRRDPHEDHRATWEICRAVAGKLAAPVRWVEYPVWMWEAKNTVDLPRPGEVIPWSLDVAAELGVKERAIRAHASQWDGVIDDDPTGFQLPEDMIAHFLRPREIFFDPADKREQSLQRGYFDRIYRDTEDPWQFESSPYERDKYAATLAALPAERFRSGFEIGCSVGVLTELLAEVCEALLAVDIAPGPLVTARKRLAGKDHVRFRQMTLPGDFPAERFDLIVLSEVGYYWSPADLETAIAAIERALLPGGALVLVHYTPYVPDYPLTGDEVHEAFSQRLNNCFRIRAERTDRYRMDVWKKEGNPGSRR